MSRDETDITDPSPRCRDFGLCQWFHYQRYDQIERTVEAMRDLGVTHLRTGISWADYHRPGGREWYEWQFEALRDFEVLVSIWHTPPSIAEHGKCAGPPKRLIDFRWFVEQMIDEFGDRFEAVELWNEPNNRLKWDFINLDPNWRKFGEMIRLAAEGAKLKGKTTVLGGMIPVDHHWLQLMNDYGALEHIDVVAIHGFPEMWWEEAPNWEWYRNWRGWTDKISYISEHTGGRPIWITETGLATYDLDRRQRSRFNLQTTLLERAARAPAERAYWYCVVDLDPKLTAIEGFHVDENEYHLGLITWDGRKKPAYFHLQELLRPDIAPQPSTVASAPRSAVGS